MAVHFVNGDLAQPTDLVGGIVAVGPLVYVAMVALLGDD